MIDQNNTNNVPTKRPVFGPFYVIIMMAVFWVVVIALVGCHELEAVASKVPVTVKCPPVDVAAAEALITRFAADPDAVRHELTERATASIDGPLIVSCELLDAQSVLLETGRRYSDAFDEAQAGLQALGVFR